MKIEKDFKTFSIRLHRTDYDDLLASGGPFASLSKIVTYVIAKYLEEKKTEKKKLKKE